MEAFMLFERRGALFADAELFLGDDGAIAVDVLADQIVKEAAALAYEGLKSAGCSVVLVIRLQVLGEVFDTYREKGDLAFGAACVVGITAIGLEDFLLFFCGKMHGGDKI